MTTGFFDAFGVPVIAGRAFDGRDRPTGAPVAVLNVRAATDLFGDPRRALGQRLRLDDESWREVVGVVGNVRTTFFNTLEWRIDPIVYRPAAQALGSLGGPDAASFTFWVLVRAAQPPAAEELRAAARAAGSRAAILSIERVADLVAAATRQPTLRMTLLLWFCGASLLLAAIGVYGLVTQAAAERLREIAIRLALGATPRAVRAVFVRAALVAGVAGLALGVVSAMLLARTLDSILYGVHAGDGVSIVIAAVLLLGIVGMAAWVPAARATRVSALRALCGGLLLAIAVTPVHAQDGSDVLPRRAWLGVALAPHEGGVAVTAVADGSTAAAEGMRVGDVIRAIDSVAVRTPPEVVAAITRHASGTTAVIDFVRAGVPQQRRAVLRPLLREALPGVVFEYGSVELSDGARLRTILSKPDGEPGRRPAVLFLQGGGCSSVDVPQAFDAGPGDLLRAAAVRGYVTMRVEKSGLGDSQGPPCERVGYLQELEGYRAALAALKAHPAVDPRRVHLLGLSLGGFFAPILAAGETIAGILVYGTLDLPPSPYPGRSDQFFREIAAVDVRDAWGRVDAKVLVVHGQFDEVANEADHARIASIVNARHPGRALHRELAGLDHCWTWHESMEKSQGHCGAGRQVPALRDTLMAFLESPG